MDTHDFNAIKQFRSPGVGRPVPLIRNVAINANSDPEYVGIAVQGSATSDAVWFVEKITYDGSNNYSNSRVSVNIAWDNRLAATYT